MIRVLWPFEDQLGSAVPISASVPFARGCRQGFVERIHSFDGSLHEPGAFARSSFHSPELRPFRSILVDEFHIPIPSLKDRTRREAAGHERPDWSQVRLSGQSFIVETRSNRSMLPRAYMEAYDLSWRIGSWARHLRGRHTLRINFRQHSALLDRSRFFCRIFPDGSQGRQPAMSAQFATPRRRGLREGVDIRLILRAGADPDADTVVVLKRRTGPFSEKRC